MRKFRASASFAICLTLGLTACVPKIYVIDRQTVLEDEAAGEWPQFEKRLIPQTQEKTPTPQAQVRDSERKQKLYKVLNGPVISK
jgi:hypothetical protein